MAARESSSGLTGGRVRVRIRCPCPECARGASYDLPERGPQVSAPGSRTVATLDRGPPGPAPCGSEKTSSRHIGNQPGGGLKLENGGTLYLVTALYKDAPDVVPRPLLERNMKYGAAKNFSDLTGLTATAVSTPVSMDGPCGMTGAP